MRFNDTDTKILRPLLIFLCFSLAINHSWTCFADDIPVTDDKISQLKSAHFDIYTDLDKATAQTHLRSMKATLADATKYWGRHLKGQIRCYLIDDLSNWTQYELPLKQAKIIVKQIGGATIVDSAASSQQGYPQAFIYASTEPGVVEHEVIHAYCFQTFGTGGPAWYREGMAELLAMNANPRTKAVCRDRNLDILDNGTAPSLRRILARTNFTKSIADLLGKQTIEGRDVEFDIAPLEEWSTSKSPEILEAQTAYAESWALCYLLYHNPNYQRRFRMVGKHLLTNPRARFEDAFKPMMENIDFELKQLAQHIGDGYRADLCRWEWNQSFSKMGIGRTINLQLKAKAGYQATGIAMSPNEMYEVQASGAWLVREHEPQTNANGDADGCGQLEAALLTDFSLTSPKVLGKSSTYSSAKDGHLYLRCHDDWLQLSDNRGMIKVRIKRIQ